VINQDDEVAIFWYFISHLYLQILFFLFSQYCVFTKIMAKHIDHHLSTTSTSPISSRLPLWQDTLQWQVSRTSTNIHGLRIGANHPVLTCGVPVGDISASQSIGEGLALSWVEDEIIESTEDDLGVGWAT
jgi:hypothetical protein